MTWGLIEAFVAWQIREGFSIASTNARLSTVKSYAAFNFEELTLTFWRKKTKEWTTHELTVAAYKTAVSYQPLMPAEGGIFLGSRKGAS